MIKVALPNKGMLFEPTQELLKACGYKASKPYKTLTQLDTKNGIEFFFLRPSDIPMYVGRGIIDAGITGIDFNAEAKSPAVKVLDLPFGASKMCAAVPNDSPVQSLDELKDKTIATSFPNIVEGFYKKQMRDAYAFLTKDGARVLENMMAQDKRQPGKETVQVAVQSVLPMEGGKSYQVRWTETHLGGSTTSKSTTESYTGVFTVETIKSDDKAQLQANPLGLYISDFRWERDLSNNNNGKDKGQETKANVTVPQQP